jgi:hypothetical protein
MLLDPCCISDVELLWFDESGQARSNPQTAPEDSLAEARVRVSKELYHLDHVRLVRARKKVYREVRRLLEEADFAYSKWVAEEDLAAKRSYGALLLRLRALAVRESNSRQWQGVPFGLIARIVALPKRCSARCSHLGGIARLTR